jgi:hypothetical protein
MVWDEYINTVVDPTGREWRRDGSVEKWMILNNIGFDRLSMNL